MQFYILDKKCLKQSLVLAKTFLKEKNIKLPAGQVEELVAKILFQKNWNDALENCNKPARKVIKNRTVYLTTRKASTIMELSSLIGAACIKANYNSSAIKELCAISETHFSFVMDLSIANTNELTFLFFLVKNQALKYVTRQRIDVEVESLATEFFLEEKSNKNITPEHTNSLKDSAEIDTFLRIILGPDLYEKEIEENSESLSSYKKFLSGIWSCNTEDFHKKADFVYQALSNLNSFYTQASSKSDYANRAAVQFLSKFKNPNNGSLDTIAINQELGGLLHLLSYQTQKIDCIKFLHPDCDSFLVLEASEYAASIALNTLVGDDADEENSKQLTQIPVKLSKFEFENMPEFNG